MRAPRHRDTPRLQQGAETLLGLLRRIVETPVPVIAHLHGNARAGGLGIVAAADIAVAPADTTFSFSEVRLGLAPAIISLTVLPRIDERAAGRYFLTGEAFDGTTAQSVGLLTEATRDASAAEDSVRQLVSAPRLCSRQGLTESKKLTTARVRHVLTQQGDAMVKLSADLFASEEAAEGMRAFREHRPPRWAPSR
ncbi:enoyl-CoA hydratase-related protein [Streptomyces sp. NPDC002896]|uniref:enoyl-CoA hydratase-related protein n=1 Tax=Streptomyces sp. NPDC002896 TaxID=3154438 RepID=UPI0033222F9E